MKQAGSSGYFTNHSLRVSAATRLFESNVDEQLIMDRTGHSSKGVRAYKQTTTKLCEVTSNILNADHINNETASEVTTSKPTASKWITSEPTASGPIDTRKGDKENLSSPVPSGVSSSVTNKWWH